MNPIIKEHVVGKLFKDKLEITDTESYNEFIDESLKPFGFGNELDDALNDIKKNLFTQLLEATENSGPSFDSEILFSSFISDLESTHHSVAEHLLTIQRRKEN